MDFPTLKNKKMRVKRMMEAAECQKYSSREDNFRIKSGF